ncbi:heavy metal translocating P-type ATPase [Liquorilactobacillus uvarum]|uniref:Cd(2+)-exporting ATPase n=1 Tax=Liquorilactobacillus uvarum DSM 19971 TaxID=1423812 RepID=A0A0R1QDR3_9LACO|nr:cation-translocating P-type ATPase [Liquorilactobacillus uvarum]KRL38984.1 copper-translocating P-type ATPase [Liquorilactobacillus uvarum DSM 19971]
MSEQDHTESLQKHNMQNIWARIERDALNRILITAFLALIVIILEILVPQQLWAIIAVTAIGLFCGCWPIIIESWHDIRQRKMSMDLSMFIAIVAAAAIGQWITSLVITIFVLAADILEDLCMDQGKSALTDLMSFLPETVRVKNTTSTEKNTIQQVTLKEVLVKQVVVISPGERIPVDGTVINGFSSVDQSRITGESMPVEVASGAYVYAGSINRSGALEVRAERVGEESSYGQTIAAVQEAQSNQAPIQKLADKFAAFLIYTAIAGAVITWFFTQNLHSAIDVIIVAGACGIAAGTPLAMLASIARAARTGAFVKGGSYMEALAHLDTIIFDKTGTLTFGTPKVTEIVPVAGVSDKRLLQIAASAEWHSEHPLGKAIIAAANERGEVLSQPDSFENKPGQGLTTVIDGHTIKVGNAGHLGQGLFAEIEQMKAQSDNAGSNIVYISYDNRYIGKILLADSIRENAVASIAGLKKMGLRVIILTGDRTEAAETIAAKLQVDEVRAELMPEEKLAAIDAERRAGHKVAMVGDGVNDAPSLAQADVGIAMGSGTDIARDSSKIVLISSNLGDVKNLIGLSRRTRRIVNFNFAGTIVIDSVGMLLAGFGILTPLVAAIIHVGSESIFILNSARLIPGKSKK